MRDGIHRLIAQKVENPRAVAIVIGGLGQETESVQQTFATPLYEGCSTLSAASPPSAFAMHNLRPVAANVIKETAHILRDSPPSTPLVAHVFSNGGAIVLEQMEVIVREVLEEKHEERAKNGVLEREDAQLVHDRMEYQFFDSSPCYLHEIWSPTSVSKSFPNKNWSRLGRSAYYLASAFSLSLWNLGTLSLHRPRQFWKAMVESPCRHQVYAYSTADMLSDAYRVEELIETRRKKGVEVTVLKYNDSGHCRLFRDHKEDYVETVNTALEGAIHRGQQCL